MFCCHEWEWSPELRHAIQQNQLVNFHGTPGHGLALDLMQEHHNFLLEDFAQHKGKEFGDDLYRRIISLCIRDFPKLKEKMEGSVGLQGRTKRHGAQPLDTELKNARELLRSNNVAIRRPGRKGSFRAPDHFEAGWAVVEQRIPEFLHRTTMSRNVFAGDPATTQLTSPAPAADESDPDSDWMNALRDEIDDDMALPLTAGVDDDGTRVWLERGPRISDDDGDDMEMRD